MKVSPSKRSLSLTRYGVVHSWKIFRGGGLRWRGCLLSLWRELCPRHGRPGWGASGNFLGQERHELLHRKRESPSGSLRLRGSLRLWCGGLLQWWGGVDGIVLPGLVFLL